MITIA